MVRLCRCSAVAVTRSLACLSLYKFLPNSTVKYRSAVLNLSPVTSVGVQSLGTAAIALDLRQWQKRKSWAGARQSPAPNTQAGRSERAAMYRPTNSPVQFLARDSRRSLKALRASLPNAVHKQRQLISSQQACQTLSLTQSVGDVRSLVFSIMRMDKGAWKSAEWVRAASDEVVCAVVDRLVRHNGWDTALQVVQATLGSSEEAEDASKVLYTHFLQWAVLRAVLCCGFLACWP